MINDTLIRKGDGATQTWVLSPPNTELVSVKVDGVSVAYTRPTWNTVKLQAAPAEGAEVAFDFTGAVPTNAVTALESRVATLELMQGTGDNELELETVVLSAETVVEETYPIDPSAPEMGTNSMYLYKVDGISQDVRKLFIHVTCAEGYTPPGNVTIRLPVGFDGVVSVANLTPFPVDLFNQAAVDKRKNQFVETTNYPVTEWVVSNAYTTYIYRDAPTGQLLSFQRSTWFTIPETQHVTFISGNAAASSTVFQRIGTGVTKLGSVFVEGNAPSHDMTVTAELQTINLSGGGGFYTISQHTATVPAGSHSSFTFEFVSGSAPDFGGFTGHTAGRIRYTISYAGSPTTLASDVQILSGTKSGSEGMLVLVP